MGLQQVVFLLVARSFSSSVWLAVLRCLGKYWQLVMAHVRRALQRVEITPCRREKLVPYKWKCNLTSRLLYSLKRHPALTDGGAARATSVRQRPCQRTYE